MSYDKAIDEHHTGYEMQDSGKEHDSEEGLADIRGCRWATGMTEGNLGYNACAN